MGEQLEIELRHRLSRLALDARLSVGPETVALVGPSGAGKTTMLRVVAGLLRPDRGQVALAGRVLLDTERGLALSPEARRVGLVPQDGALFPFLTVLRNVAYGVRADRRGRVRAARRALERLGVGHIAAARPADLSGGERQRVALARAVAAEPEALLLDEPLSALDPVTKADVASELEGLLAELRLPAILVSHDFADVLGLAHRVAVLQDGRIVQTGTASELVEAPASAFVASLAGVNYLTGTGVRQGDLTEIRATGWSRPLMSADEVIGHVGVVVYPWEISVGLRAPEGSALNAVPGRVRRVALMGNRARVSVEGHPSIVAEVTDESVRHLRLRAGTPVVVTWKATATRLVPLSGPGAG